MIGPSRPRPRTLRLALLLPAAALLVLLSSVLPVRADGAFVKSGRVYLPVPIPAQRALIVHRDGVETLVVESTAAAEAQALGWILPVPAKPTSIERVTPGILDTLDLATRPRISPEGDLPEVLLLPGLILLLVFIVGIHRADASGDPPSRISPARLLLLLLLVAIGLSVLTLSVVPHAQLSTSAAPLTGVASGGTRRIGNYEVAVLDGGDAAALPGWLSEQGLAPLPATALPVVGELVADGWHFVVVRLLHEGGGPAAPHPLSLAFPAPSPVYPMRLTALAGGATDLRLHVVAEGSAACPPLRVGFSGRFEEAGDGPVHGPFGSWTAPMLHHGEGRDARGIAHPSLLPLLWDGCVVTRIEGTLGVEEMEADLVPRVGPYAARSRILHTTREAWREPMAVVLPFWALGILLLVLVRGPAPPDPVRSASSLLRGLIVLTIGAAAATAGLRATLTAIPGDGVLEADRHGELGWHLVHILGTTDGYAGGPRDGARALLENRFRAADLRNPFTGQPLGWGDSPGCLDLAEDHRGPVLWCMGMEGASTDIPWHDMRIQEVLGNLPPLKGNAGIEDARARLFPRGVLVGGLRNPFSGEPVREREAPGDSTVVEAGRCFLLRTWYGDGRSRDFQLR